MSAPGQPTETRLLAFWKAVLMDTTDFLERIVRLLEGSGVQYCVIGSQGVNAYAEPVVSLDLDVAVAAEDLPQIEALLKQQFSVEPARHGLDVTLDGSDLRVHIWTEPHLSSCIARSDLGEVLGLSVPVAHVEDVLHIKVWMAGNAEREGWLRQQDLADIARLVTHYPHLKKHIPPRLLSLLII